MAALTRFEELFGDEADNFASTPTLQDVIPGLISSDSQYASKELNKGRKATTGRSFRSPVPRSLTTQQPTITNIPSEETEWADWNPPFLDYSPRPNNNFKNNSGPGDGGRGDQDNYRIQQQGETGRLGEGTLGNAVGDSLAASLGITGLLGAAAATAGAVSMGAPSSMLPSIAMGNFASSALNPIVAANIVGGGLVAGQMGYNAGQEAQEQGYGLTDEGVENVSRGVFSIINPGIGGLAELGVETIASLFSDNIMSPAEIAGEQGGMIAAGERGAAMMEAEYGGSATGLDNAWGGTDAGLVGPDDPNTAISEAFDVNAISPDTSSISPTSGVLGDGGIISQGLVSMGFGGNVSGVQGVGLGGSTNAVTGMQQGVFGEPGINPHASEMGIAAAPSPTVGGIQGHGSGLSQAPTGRGDSGGSGGFGGSYGGGGFGAPTGETGEGLSGGGGAGK